LKRPRQLTRALCFIDLMDCQKSYSTPVIAEVCDRSFALTRIVEGKVGLIVNEEIVYFINVYRATGLHYMPTAAKGRTKEQ